MLYNKDEHSRYVLIAGRISIAAAVVGFSVFLVAFLVDLGSQELSKASAQTASTTLIVLNTPPEFVVAPYEVPDSATSTPINTGDTMTWEAIATDSNTAPYFLLICSNSASPTADYLDIGDGTGVGEPRCHASAVQWGVSAPAASGALATVSTTTASTAISQFEEVNEWFAWVCDDDQANPRCSNLFYQGPTSTTASSSPFHVNNRPNLVSVPTPASADPGGDIVFTTVSYDPDVVGGEDEILIVVCRDAGDYNPTTNDCDANFIASTTVSLLSNASATYTLPAVIRDDSYPVHVFLVDEHGHEAVENPVLVTFDVNNVAPVVIGGDIFLQPASTTLVLTVPGGETPGFVLNFTISDANSCVTAASTTDEIAGYQASVFRAMLNSTSTCDGATPGQYDPNDCYTTAVATSTWNLDCTPNTAACTSPLVDELEFNCTFPLWFVADPTDVGTPAAYEADIWTAAVAGVDNDGLVGNMATATNQKDLTSFTAIDLLTAEIAYGSIEAGGNTGSFNASTTILSIGNTGVDQELFGAAMCGSFSPTSTCPVSTTSTIPASEQEFSASTFSYGAGTNLATTTQELELDVLKSISTSTPERGTTYWGIAVPATIQLSGSYRGLNTFIGVTAEPADWTP